MKQILVALMILAFVFTMAGCAGMTHTEKTTAGGAAVGAAGGGILGAIGGHPLAGAAIGAGIGGLGGYIYGEHGK
jgi:hypothetical protein